jgi:hypothetical protein
MPEALRQIGLLVVATAILLAVWSYPLLAVAGVFMLCVLGG